MRIRLKGFYGIAKRVPKENRGRTYEIGYITAGVTLSEDGLTLHISNKKLAKGMEDLINKLKSDEK